MREWRTSALPRPLIQLCIARIFGVDIIFLGGHLPALDQSLYDIFPSEIRSAEEVHGDTLYAEARVMSRVLLS